MPIFYILSITYTLNPSHEKKCASSEDATHNFTKFKLSYKANYLKFLYLQVLIYFHKLSEDKQNVS